MGTGRPSLPNALARAWGRPRKENGVLVSQEGHCLSDLARVVLAAAVRAHVEDRILVSKNKTVVFD